jgi:hypothetical protein
MFYELTCPHCKGEIIVEKNQLHCRIFRHGVYRANMQQINPHAPKEECYRLAESNQIIGCGKPFLVIDSKTEPNKKVAIECDYI